MNILTVENCGLNLSKLRDIYIEEDHTVQDIVADPPSESYLAILADIAEVSAIVEGYCLPRYEKIYPWNPVPTTLVQIAKKLFKQTAYDRRDMVDDNIRKGAEAALKMLADIQGGKLKLITDQDSDGQAETPVAEDTVQHTRKSPGDKVFSNLQGYF